MLGKVGIPSRSSRVLKGCGLTQCGDTGRGMGERKERRESSGQFLKLFGVLVVSFFWQGNLIKILLLQIRSSSCSINIIQSKGKRREDGCLLMEDR